MRPVVAIFLVRLLPLITHSSSLNRRRELLSFKAYNRFCSVSCDASLQRVKVTRLNHDNNQHDAYACLPVSQVTPQDDDSLLVVRPTSSFQEAAGVAGTSQKMWPPWPFNLLSRRPPSSRHYDSSRPYPSSPTSPLQQHQQLTNAHLFWSFLRQSAQAGLRNIQQVTNELLFHLPPAAQPLILFALIPQQRPKLLLKETMQGIMVKTGGKQRAVVVPLVSNPFARNMALTFLGLAVLSWASDQVHRKRLLTPLPLLYQDINRAVLPPFLPEEETYLAVWEEEANGVVALEEEDDEDEVLKSLPSSSSSSSTERVEDEDPRDLYSSKLNSLLQWGAEKPKTLQTTLRAWKRMRRLRKRDRRNAQRMAVMEQLMALQKLKKNVERKRLRKTRKSSLLHNHRHLHGHSASGSGASTEESIPPLGFALVTGASRGIGRAIAVELSRWGIPLILVARDIDRLTSLAFDLEACYGVDCCVLQADLTKPGIAAEVYQTIKEAALPVDILVNNAGFSSQGLSVDLPTQQVDDMLALNIQAVSALTHLFGKDMKDRKRGRMLMVSSVCGAVSGIPTVAVYSATKAFERTLSVSLAKEMEPYGVGVTCLLPGAVRDTEFRSRSNAGKALCWNIPFYLKTPPQIAEVGVRAMLRGETEVTPGWMNRVFLKIMQPALPQRLHSLIAEFMWNPLHLPFTRRGQSDVETKREFTESSAAPELSSSIPPTIRLRYKIESAPRLLKLDERLAPSATVKASPGSASFSTNSSSVDDESDAPNSEAATSNDSSDEQHAREESPLPTEAVVAAPSPIVGEPKA